MPKATIDPSAIPSVLPNGNPNKVAYGALFALIYALGIREAGFVFSKR